MWTCWRSPTRLDKSHSKYRQRFRPWLELRGHRGHLKNASWERDAVEFGMESTVTSVVKLFKDGWWSELKWAAFWIHLYHCNRSYMYIFILDRPQTYHLDTAHSYQHDTKGGMKLRLVVISCSRQQLLVITRWRHMSTRNKIASKARGISPNQNRMTRLGFPDRIATIDPRRR